MTAEVHEDERLAQFRRENDLVAEAMRLARHDAELLHKRAGQPLVTWKDGQVVLIPPEQIVVE